MEEAVQTCETDLRHKSITGHQQHNCKGLGYVKTPNVPSKISSKEYMLFTSSHFREIDKTYAISKVVQLKVQS